MPETVTPVSPSNATPSADPTSARAAAALTCCHCGTPLASVNPDVCPRCRRSQTRTCFCTERVPWNVDRCPSCGTDWDRVRRAQRAQRAEQKRHQRELRLAVWRHILAGGIVLLTLSVTALAILLTR